MVPIATAATTEATIAIFFFMLQPERLDSSDARRRVLNSDDGTWLALVAFDILLLLSSQMRCCNWDSGVKRERIDAAKIFRFPILLLHLYTALYLYQVPVLYC